jgi:hypothetical protein
MMDPTDDLMLAPDAADPQQFLENMLALAHSTQNAKTGATASTFPTRRVIAQAPTPIPPVGPLPTPSVTGETPTDGGGMDWRALIRLIAPAIGSLVAGGGHQMPAFWSAYQTRQAEMEQERQKQQQGLDNKRKAAAQFLLETEKDAEGYDDPVLLAQHLSAADDAGALAGFTKPGELKNKYTVSANKLAQKKLDELNTLLDQAEKSYNLDDLAASGAVLTTKDGAHVPVATAIDLTRKRPLDAKGQPIAKPAKAARTEEERFVAQRAKEYGYKSVDDVPTDTQIEWLNDRNNGKRPDTKGANAGTFGDYLERYAKEKGTTTDALTTKDIEAARKRYQTSDKDPQIAQMNFELKQLQLDGARNKAKTAGAIVDIQPGTKEYRIASDLATGDLTMADFTKLLTARGAGGQNVNDMRMSFYDKAREINPNFSPAAFEMGYKFASSPKVKAQMASLRNVLSGVDDLLKVSDEASRTGVPLINQIVLPAGRALGGKRYSNFHTAQIAFADELSGALGYGSATDMSREMGFDMTDPTLSPEQFRSAVQTVLIPFVNRKKASLVGEMGPYAPKSDAATTPATPIKVGVFTVKVKP